MMTRMHRTAVLIVIVATAAIFALLQTDRLDPKTSSAPSVAPVAVNGGSIETPSAAETAPAAASSELGPGCVRDVDPLGTTTICPSGRPRHPYKDYDSETLRTLVYSDAMACEILSWRVFDIDKNDAIQLAIRASALNHGDPGPFGLLAIRIRYAAEPEHVEETGREGTYYPDDLNGLDLEVVKELYVYRRLANDASFVKQSQFEIPLRELEKRSFPSKQLNLLDAEVLAILEQMREIEYQVRGERL